MLKRLFVAIALAVVLVTPVSLASSNGQVRATSTEAETRPIICSVMEAFEEKRLGVCAIVFHQRDKADGPRLGSLLLTHSGREMELETNSGQHFRATVFRVKSCFGRGLAMVPTSKLKLGENDEFTLRLR